MADDAHKLLIKVESDTSDIGKLETALNSLVAAEKKIAEEGLKMTDALKFDFIFQGVEKLVNGVIELGEKTAEVTANFIKGTIEAAAEIQTETFPLTAMLKGHEEVAEQVLRNLHSLWQDLGVISNESIASAARNLLLIGTPAQNLVSTLTALSKIALGSGVSLDNMVAAWQRFRQAAESGREPAVRGLGGFGAATEALARTFAHSMGIIFDGSVQADTAVKRLVANGTLGIDQMKKSMNAATGAGGEFFDVIDKKKATWDGAIAAMETAWKGFRVELGTPIINTLTPMIEKITEIGKRLQEIAHEQGWQIALRATWTILWDNLAKIAIEVIENKFVQEAPWVGIHLAVAISDAFDRAMTNLSPAWMYKALGIPDAEELAKRQAEMARLRAEHEASIKGADSPEVKQAIEDLKKLAQGFFDVRVDIDELAHAIGADVNESFIAKMKQALGQGLPDEVSEGGKQDVLTRNLSAAMHDLQAAMAAVRQEQTLLAANPFISPDNKQALSINLYAQELVRLKAAMDNLRAQRDSPFANTAQIEAANQKLQDSAARVKTIGIELAKLATPFRTELANWAQSFGSTAHQISATIQGTINTSLQALNQYLVTGKFNAQALLQQIILLGLQLVEQLIIQRVIGVVNSNANVAQAAIEGPAIAAALSPAVTAQTIATDGVAAINAPGLVAAANAAILAVLAAPKQHEGGAIGGRRFHAGGLAHDEVPIIAQEGEIMIQRSIAQIPGMAEFLLGLNAGEFHQGGFVFGGRYHRGSGMDVGSNVFGPDSPFGKWGGPDFGGFSNYDPSTARMMMMLSGGGFMGPIGSNWFLQGPTMIPTTVGSSGYPRAVEVGPGTDVNVLGVSHHTPPKIVKHAGGAISRFHSGGSVGAGAAGGGGIHIYAFTDLKQLTRHLASKEGQKIIFDTVKGRRIDLGIS